MIDSRLELPDCRFKLEIDNPGELDPPYIYTLRKACVI